MKHLGLILLLTLAQALGANLLDQPPFDVVVPQIEFRDQSLEECLDVVRKHLPGGYSITYVADPTKLPGFSKQTIPEPSGELSKVSFAIADASLGTIVRRVAKAAGARVSCAGKAITIYPDIGTTEPFVERTYLWNSPASNLKLSKIPIYAQTKIDYSEGGIRFTAPFEVHERMAFLVARMPTHHEIPANFGYLF
jgi:hypothetical protein